eukprot:9502248-Pyramimonas_sp.AAC.1
MAPQGFQDRVFRTRVGRMVWQRPLSEGLAVALPVSRVNERFANALNRCPPGKNRRRCIAGQWAGEPWI